MRRIRWDPHPQHHCFRNFVPRQKWPINRKRWESEGARSGLYFGCGTSSIPPNYRIFVIVVRSLWGLALSFFNRTLFRLTNAGYLLLKTSWTRSSCWQYRSASTARPFATISQWITPSKLHLTNNIILGPNHFLTLTLASWRGLSHCFDSSGLC